MKHWFSAAELVGLPGMPGTDRAIQLRAKREAWKSQPRAGRGGGREYSLASLPPATRAHLAAQDLNNEAAAPEAKAGAGAARTVKVSERIREIVAHESRQTGLAELARLPGSNRRRAEARLDLVISSEDYCKRSHLPVSHALVSFCHLYNSGELEIAAAVRAEILHVHPSTLQRWRSRLAAGGVIDLSGRYRNRKGTSKIDSQEPLRQFCTGFVHDYPHASAQHIHEGLRARFHRDPAVILPSKRGVERWLNAWREANAQTFLAISNPDAWRGKRMVAHGSFDSDRLNGIWEFDATPADIMLIDGRHSITGVIDVYSRRPKLLVTKTPTAVALSALLRWALLKWGIPEIAKTDNGQEYVGHHTARVLRALEIEHVKCPPFEPHHKPHIERFFNTFSHHLVELMPGFIGHNVAERNAIENRKSFADRLFKKGEVVEVALTSAQLQQIADEWCESLYMHRTHHGLDGKTPAELVRNWREPVKRIPNERALDLLLAEAPDNHGRRTVGKKGIRIKWAGEPRHHWYIAPELGEWVGQEVFVQFDPAGDMGRIYVSGCEQFICVAECPELTGIDRAEHAALARATQKQWLREQKENLRKDAKAANTRGIAAEILAHHRAQIANLVEFPKAEEAYDSEGLNLAAAGIEAADLIDRGIKRDLPEEVERELAEIVTLPVRPAELTDEEEWQQDLDVWEALDARIRAGETVSASDRQWHLDFQNLPGFRSRWHMRHEFGQLPK